MRRIDGERRNYKDYPAKKRWYYQQRMIRYARYLAYLASH